MNCNQGTNTCQVTVPAPGFALVFVGTSDANGDSVSTQTFATTAYTNVENTATVAPSWVFNFNDIKIGAHLDFAVSWLQVMAKEAKIGRSWGVPLQTVDLAELLLLWEVRL